MLVILDKIHRDNLILFIDDFHLADDDVKDLVKNSRGIVVSSRRRVGVARNEIPLRGIREEDRDELIELISKRLNIEIDYSEKERIKDIAEGHPVSTEVLMRNYEKMGYGKIEGYKHGLDLSNPEHVEEFL